MLARGGGARTAGCCFSARRRCWFKDGEVCEEERARAVTVHKITPASMGSPMIVTAAVIISAVQCGAATCSSGTWGSASGTACSPCSVCSGAGLFVASSCSPTANSVCGCFAGYRTSGSSCALCVGSHYSYGGSWCAQCAGMASFVSASTSCTPAGPGPTDTAFYLSGDGSEGITAFSATGVAPTFVADHLGAANAALALASGSHLDAPGVSAPQPLPSGGNTAFSASAWVNCAAPQTYSAVLEWGAAGDAQGLVSPQTIALVVAGPAGGPGASPLSIPACDSTWHHIALTYSPPASSQIAIYLDGSPLSSSSATITLPSSSASTLRIGWNGAASTNAGSLFAGSVSDLRLYSRALTAAEVLQLVPCTGSSTWSASGLPPCQACITCSGVVKAACSPTTNTVCGPSASLPGPADTAFYLSGSRADGTGPFTYTGGVSPTFVADHLGAANAALALTRGSYLYMDEAGVPAALRTAFGGSFTLTAWVMCGAPATYAAVLELGNLGDTPCNGYDSRLGIQVTGPSATTYQTTEGAVSTLAGTYRGWEYCTPPSSATGVAACFYRPSALAVIPSSSLIIVADNNRLLLVSPLGLVSILAGNDNSVTGGFSDDVGTAASFHGPSGVAVVPSSENIIVADTYNSRIRMVTLAGLVSTLAGDGTEAYADGLGPAASFNRPMGVAVIPVSEIIAVADTSKTASGS